MALILVLDEETIPFGDPGFPGVRRIAATCGATTICGAPPALGFHTDDCLFNSNGFGETIGHKAGPQFTGSTPGGLHLCAAMEAVSPTGYELPAGDHTVSLVVSSITSAAGLRWKKTTVCMITASTCTAISGGSLGILSGQNINMAKLGTKSMTISCVVSPVDWDNTIHALYYQLEFEHPTGEAAFCEIKWNGAVNAPLVLAPTYRIVMLGGHVTRAAGRIVMVG